MLKEAYEYGQRLAAAEKGYATYDDFLKEAAPIKSMLGSVGSAMWRGGSRGALGGAAVGAAGNAAFGDQTQGLGERLAKGAIGGAAVGGSLGAIGGGVGQSMYRNNAAQQMRSLRGPGGSAARNTLRTQQNANPYFLDKGLATAGAWGKKQFGAASRGLFG